MRTTAPNDWETIRRSMLRRFIHSPRRSSYPFLSGDTFRGLCQFEFNGVSLEEINPHPRFFNYIFMQVDSIYAFRNFVDSNPDFYPTKSQFSLVLHNSDTSLTINFLEDCLTIFKRIYSVNLTEESEQIKALPMGLENRVKLRNGVERDFRNRKFKQVKGRKIDFLSCFSVETNRFERESAALATSQLKNSKVITIPLTPKKYRNYLESSKFVISPPGNGPDCHRTWEALYLGAIPIVKKKFWPFKEENLPIIYVDDWNQIGEKAQSNLLRNENSFCSSFYASPEYWLCR